MIKKLLLTSLFCAATSIYAQTFGSFQPIITPLSTGNGSGTNTISAGTNYSITMLSSGTTVQPFNTSTYTAISNYSSVVTNSGGFVVDKVNGNITISNAGFYKIDFTFMAQVNGSADTNLGANLAILQNGSAIANTPKQFNTGPTGRSFTYYVSSIVNCSVGDTIAGGIISSVTPFSLSINGQSLTIQGLSSSGSGGGGSGDVTTAQLLDATNKVTTAFQASDAAVSNIMVSFTITTNLAYTNWLESAGASNSSYNVKFIWSGTKYANGSAFVTNNNGAFILGLDSPPVHRTAFTNDSWVGLFKTNSIQSTPPYVFYPSNAVITTNWFIAGASFKMPVPAVNFEDYGGRGDAVKLYSATVNAGQLITTNASFTSDMVGRWAAIYSTPSNTAYMLTRVAVFNNSTNVTLATNYTQSTPYEAQIFTDNFIPMTNMLGSLSGSVVINYTGLYGDNYGFASSAIHPMCGHSYVINIPANLSTDPRTNTSRTIVMNGRLPDLIYPQFIPSAGGTNTSGSPNLVGTVLLNFAKPVTGVTNAFVLADGTGQGYSQFAKECVVWQNMQLRQPGKPTHHALWRARGGTTALINFGFSVDMSKNWLNVTSGVPPFYMESIVSNANSIFCDYGPDPYNYAGSYYENATFGYHGTAFRAEEHLVGSGKISMVGCGSGMYLDAAAGNLGTFTGPVFPMLYSYLCQYPIVISTNSTQREPLWVGSFNTEEGYPSVQIGPMIYDPLKRGQIVIGNITGTSKNTTIQSTNGQWHDSIKNYSYDSGVIVSNGTVTATTFTANGGFIFPYLQPTTNGINSQGGIVGCNGTNYWSVQRDSGGVLTTNKLTLTTWP